MCAPFLSDEVCMKKRQTKHGVAKVRWLIGLAESDVARRQDRLPLKRGGVAFGSVTVDDLVQALEEGQSGEGADGSAKHAAVREAYLARVEAIVALTDEDRDPDDFVTEIDEMHFAWRVDAKGRTAKPIWFCPQRILTQGLKKCWTSKSLGQITNSKHKPNNFGRCWD